jgi:hypothetical protein
MPNGSALVIAVLLAACQPVPVPLGGGVPAGRGTPPAGAPPAGAPPEGGLAGAVPLGAVSLRTNSGSYERGTAATLTLVNPTSHSVDFSTCSAELEREAGGRWQPQRAVAGACERNTTLAPPRGSASGRFELPEELPQARYRFRLDVTSREGGRAVVHSNTFRVH